MEDVLLPSLERLGLLLLHDAHLPSVSALVAGAPVSGSWWGHPKGGEIFRGAGALVDHRDVHETRLVGGKVTYVHRRLWPALLGAARSGEPWQLQSLPREAQALLDRVRKEDMLASGRPAKLLEERLLVSGREVHTDSGRHARGLESWLRWAERKKVRPLPSEEAKAALEEAAAALGGGRLPWQVRRS